MKTSTIIFVSLLVLVIIGGIFFYIYTKENKPLVQNPTICTSFTYSNWGSCSSSGSQSRTVISSSPSGCSGGSPILSQTCTYNSTSSGKGMDAIENAIDQKLGK